jgi:hypothetical protein
MKIYKGTDLTGERVSGGKYLDAENGMVASFLWVRFKRYTTITLRCYFHVT